MVWQKAKGKKDDGEKKSGLHHSMMKAALSGLLTFVLPGGEFVRLRGEELEVRGGLLGREDGVVGLAVAAGDDAYVALSLAEGRHAVVLVHVALARVVARERERHVAVEALEEEAQVLDARVDVRLGVVRVLAAEALGRRGHELHEPLRADVRDGRVLVLRLLPDDRVYEPGVNAVLLARAHDDEVEVEVA